MCVCVGDPDSPSLCRIDRTCKEMSDKERQTVGKILSHFDFTLGYFLLKKKKITDAPTPIRLVDFMLASFSITKTPLLYRNQCQSVR